MVARRGKTRVSGWGERSAVVSLQAKFRCSAASREQQLFRHKGMFVYASIDIKLEGSALRGRGWSRLTI